jgi:hypothetical protein
MRGRRLRAEGRSGATSGVSPKKSNIEKRRMSMSKDQPKRAVWLPASLAGALLASSVPIAPVMAADAPTELTIAAILSAGLEHAWDKAMVDAINNVKAERPHGLEIELQYSEGLWGDEAEQAMRVYAEEGEADIILASPRPGLSPTLTRKGSHHA